VIDRAAADEPPPLRKETLRFARRTLDEHVGSVDVTALPPVIPLFPLGDVVLFPGVPVPLHIFELRYRKMIADALAGARVVGMVLLRPGWEADYEGRPPVFDSGCAGTIDHSEELPDGRYNIVLRGIARFRVREELGGEPYRRATVEALADAPGPAEAVGATRGRVVELIARVAEVAVTAVARPDLSDELFVNALSQSLALEPLEKQALLDCDGVLARYHRLETLLEFRSLERTYGKGSQSSN
jgi:Lon protease-like protein